MGYFSRLVVYTLFPAVVFGADLPFSQERNPGEDWARSLADQNHLQLFANSPEGVIPEWPMGFEELRNFSLNAAGVRLYQNPNPGDFMRRGPWLYPNNGCYAKAAHVSYTAKEQQLPQPGKIYAYGNLVFDSPYAKNGRRVLWRYHMAAAYFYNGDVYVVDPGISATPLTQSEWIAYFSQTPEQVRVKFCDSRSYSPLSRCVGGYGNGAHLSHVRGLLKEEWRNLLRLGYNPYELLGL